MGIDWGRDRVGLSVSDPLWILAKPITILHKQTNYSVLSHLIDLLGEFDVGGIVVGMPSKDDNTKHNLRDTILNFCHVVWSRYPVPILLWNENFSSEDAQRLYPSRAFIDDVAATLVLQNALNNMSLISK